MAKDRLLTVRQVCALLGIARATLGRWIDEGVFPPPKVLRTRRCGRPTSIRWHADVVADWLEAAKTTVP